MESGNTPSRSHGGMTGGEWASIQANPLVSIVTSNLNHGDYLEDTILSILRQDYAPLELIIVDGASRDSSLEVIRRYADDPRVRWISEPDRGHMYAVNKGVELARGEILGIQHSTDTYQPGAIRAAVREFCADPRLTFVGGLVQTIDVQGFVQEDVHQPKFGYSDVTVDEIVRFTDYPGIQGSFFCRSRLMTIGKFVHSCHTNTYLRYFLSTVAAGGRAVRVPAVWGNYRAHPNPNDQRYKYKGLAYARQRREACRENGAEFRYRLSATQLQVLCRAGDEYEIRFRIEQRRHVVRAIPVVIRYCWLGGSFAWVMARYRSLARRLWAKLTAGKKPPRQAACTRWFVGVPSGVCSRDSS